MIRLAVIGAGRMGEQHARVTAQSGRAELSLVVDERPDRADEVASRYGAARSSARFEDAFDCDVAVLATPTDEHLSQASRLLEAGMPVLVEKPIAETVREVDVLLELAGSKGLALTCGFVERFNPVVAATQNLIGGMPTHFLSRRHSPPAPRIATSVVFDLLIHDLDLAVLFCGPSTGAPLGAGWRPTPDAVHEVADAVVRFPSSIATLSAHRHGQRKVRSVSITTTDRLFEVDLMRQDITVYRHVSHEMVGDVPGYRAETVIDIPFVRHSGEPLALQLDHFLDLVEGRADATAELRTLRPAHELAHAVETMLTSEDAGG